MKSFRKLVSEVAQPKAGDEINFKAKHEIEMYDYPVDVEDQFRSKKSKAAKRRADYNKDEDEGVYEDLDPVDKKAVNKPFRMRKDKDIDNDGDVDSSDKYLHKRRQAVTKAMKKMKESSELEEAAKIACMKCDEVSTAAAWKKNGGFCPKCKVSSQGVAESAEQLDELSPNTLHRYIKGASKDLAKRSNMSGYDARSGAYNNALKNKKKSNKRLSGITSASGRLADKANSDMYEDAWEEIPMMKRQLHFIAYAAEEIMKYLGDCEVECVDPEEWFQNKLAHIHGQMRTLHAYMEGENRMMDMYGEETELGEKLDYAKDTYIDMVVSQVPQKHKKKLETEMRKYDIKELKSRGADWWMQTGRRLHKESVELDEATTKYAIKHKKTKQVLSTHDNYEDAKDEHSGLGSDKANHGIYKQTKKDTALANRNTYREEVELDEVTRSAVKRPIQYTDARGVTRTRVTKTRPIQHDEYGQEKIKESLQEAVKAGRIKLDDGSSITVSKKDADLLNQMFKDLNKKNRKMMQDTMMTDKAGFEEIVGFAREAL